MKRSFKQFSIFCAGMVLLNSNLIAQEIPLLLSPDEEVIKEDVYVPDPPSEEDLRHYEMMAEADRKWSALFKEPGNPYLHLDVAKHYNLLGSGDIALHELGRAQELGIPRTDMLADIGRAYFLLGRYDDVMSEILLEEAPIDQHGEIYLLHGQIHHMREDLEEAFLNFYQAEQFLSEDRFELSMPLAELYSAIGDYEKAELHADKAIQFKPKDAELLILKGDLVHRREGAEKSYKYYERANFYEPDDIQTEVKLAGVLYNLNKRDEMVEVLRSILAKEQRHPFANFLIAVNFAEGNNIRTATRYLNQAGDVYDNFAPALLLKGKLGYATGSFTTSEEALRQLIRIEPGHLEARRLLGASLLQQDKNREAVNVLEFIEQQNRLEPNDYLLLGNAYVLAGNYNKGSQFLAKASEIEPDWVSEGKRQEIAAYQGGFNYGVSLNINDLINKNNSLNQRLILNTYKALENEKHREAFDNAAAIIDQNRTSPIGYNLLGLVYMKQGLAEEARSNFMRAVQIDRNFYQASLNLAKLEISLGQRNAAVNSLNQILSQDQTYVAAYELLYELAIQDGDIIQAERYLVTAINANPGLLSVRVKLLDFYFEQNNLARARTIANRMQNAFPEHAAPYKALGKVDFLEGDFDAASGYLQKAVELDATDDETYVMLAKSLSEIDRHAESRNILQSGLYYVHNKFPLQLALIELAKQDGDFKNSQLYVNQLKLDERTKARALLFEAELYLLQQRAEDAISSFESAAKAGANQDLVADGIAQARELVANQITEIQSEEDELQ